MVTKCQFFIIKVTKMTRGGKNMKGLVVTALTVAFGFVAYEKLTDVVEVVKHLVA